MSDDTQTRKKAHYIVCIGKRCIYSNLTIEAAESALERLSTLFKDVSIKRAEVREWRTYKI